MSVYGGYDPGTFQAWALNLFTNIFVKAGIARGMSVTQTATPSMAVLVNLDPTANDGVVYLANGCWLRIDAQQTFSIGANSSGSTRTDALVATVDPSGTPAPSLSIQANWPNGFTAPSANEFVVALISVANGASSILNANITLNSATASVTASGGSSNSMTASDGVGLSVQDSSASSVLSVVLTGLTTGEGRAITIQTTDSSAIGHQFTFGTDSSFRSPGRVVGSYVEGHPISGSGNDDGVALYDRNGIQGVVVGVNQSGGGFYVYDQLNAGFILQNGTNGGITIPGTLNCYTFGTTGTNILTSQPSGNDVLDLRNGANTTWQVNIGMSTNGMQIWDQKNGGFIFSAATKTGITFNGNIYANGGNHVLQSSSAGGGSAGGTTWEGTTDPGAFAGEGDIWVDG